MLYYTIEVVLYLRTRHRFGLIEMIYIPFSCCRLIEKLKAAGLMKDSSYAASPRKIDMQRIPTAKDGGIPVEVNYFPLAMDRKSSYSS